MSDAESIANEIHGILAALIAGYEACDMAPVRDAFCDGPDFLMMNTDGALCGFDIFYDNDAVYLDACADFTLTTHDTQVRIMDADCAVLAWSYSAEALLKTGERDRVDKAGASFIFVRRAGAWKCAYYHQSSGAFTRLPADP